MPAPSPSIKKVAVIGLGVGRAHILEGFLPLQDRFEVSVLCDTDAERLTAVGDEFGVTRRTTRFADVLAMDDIDIIDICTPPVAHLEQILAGLATNKHVICEKPLVGSLADVDRVMAAERISRGKLMPIFQYRYGDGIQKAKAIINAGLAGKPYIATAETHWRRDAPYYAVPWRGKWASELGGVMIGHAIHLHDMLTYLMGPIAAVFGRVDTRVNPIETEDCASASLLMANGALATLSATLGSAQEISRLRLCFENVLFESNHEPYSPGKDPWQIIPTTPKSGAAIDTLLADWHGVPERYQTQMALFHASLMSNTAPPVTSAEARAALELITAVYHSSMTGTQVQLPLGPTHPGYADWKPK